MIPQIGDRVGAILSANKDSVMLLGYGVFQGNKPMPLESAAQMFGLSVSDFEEEVKSMKASGEIPIDFEFLNPQILLDDGRVVWGAQCWWADEEKIKKVIGGRPIVLVNSDGTPVATSFSEGENNADDSGN